MTGNEFVIERTSVIALPKFPTLGSCLASSSVVMIGGIVNS